MNRIKKRVTVHFYSIDASDEFFRSFISGFRANSESTLSSRIFNLRQKKHLIKLSHQEELSGTQAYFITVVRERNTWQTKATSDGKITGMTLNQGIIGDPYFFMVVPDKQALLAFTSGPSGSVKSVGKTMLDQFNSDRTELLKLAPIPKEKEYSALKDMPESGRLAFEISSSALSDVSADAPQLIKEISSTPYIESNTQLSLKLEFADSSEKNLSKADVVELVDYLSDHEGCTILKINFENLDGQKMQLDFGNAFLNFRTEILTRHKYVDEKASNQVMVDALEAFLQAT